MDIITVLSGDHPFSQTLIRDTADSGSLGLVPGRRPDLPVCCGGSRGKLRGKLSCWPFDEIAHHPGCSSVTRALPCCRCAPEPHWWKSFVVGLRSGGKYEKSFKWACQENSVRHWQYLNVSCLTLSLQEFIFESLKVTFDRWLQSMAVFNVFTRLHERHFNITADITSIMGLPAL